MIRMHRLCELAMVAAVAVSTVLVAGCETAPSKEAMGTGIGAVVGGLLGSEIGGGHGRTVAIVAGALAGAAIGNRIGHGMDENDRRRLSHALETNPNGQPSSWRNETNGNSFTVTPTQAYVKDGRQCRAFVQEAIIDGQTREISGTACKRPDGTTWEET